MDFFLLFGPPAVGKMTIGKELERITGCKLFHNHMTIELVLPFFSFGSPHFNRLNGAFRRMIFEEVANSDLPGLIFTYVWALNEEGDKLFVDEIIEIFSDVGADIYLIELESDLSTRLERNKGMLRLEAKPSKRDTDQSEQRLLEIEDKYVMNSIGKFKFIDQYSNYLKINNTDIPPKEVAEMIFSSFKLKRID